MSRSQLACSVALTLVVVGLCPVSQGSDGFGQYQTNATSPLYISPEEATPDRPECWLVLYNLSSPNSIAWATAYQQLRGIPDENMLGLEADTGEHLGSLNAAQVQILDPVAEYFAQHPEIEERTVGILVGYGLPGHYGNSPFGGPGGFCIANALQDMNDDVKDYNPHAAWDTLPPPICKATLTPGHYLVGRIDAPSPETALAMTVRALQIEVLTCLNDQFVYADYHDAHLVNGEWYWLREAMERPENADLPWVEFDSDTESIAQDAFRFGTHDIDGWNDGRLSGKPAGPRVLAYNLNSFGATTVRSSTADGGRYVPNALKAGYAAAIGATSEPGNLRGPYPWVFIDALREGRTLGEAMFLANPYDDWVWVCVGDPLLRVGHWFNDAHCNDDWVLGDCNCDGGIDVYDINAFVLAMLDPAGYALRYPGCDLRTADLNSDGVVDGYDIDAFVSLLLGL